MNRLDRILKLGRLKPIRRKERPFEYQLRDALIKVGVLFVKTKPTIVGFPDRLALGFANMRLVEIKRDDEDLEEAQAIRHREIEDFTGERVVTVRSPDVNAAVQLIVAALRER